MNDKFYGLFKKKVYDESGLHFPKGSRVLLEGVVRRRMEEKGLKDGYRQYYELIERDDGELKELLEMMTVNLTYFFRGHYFFDMVKGLIREVIIGREGGGVPLKILSVGCSTGEEVYSIGMTVLDIFRETGYWTELDVLGVDMNLKVLDIARGGYYGREKIIEQVPKRYIEEYFIEEGEYYVVGEELRSACHFRKYNLKMDSIFEGEYGKEGKVDMIFCRNVMIYFDQDMQEYLLDKLMGSSKSEGFLFLGSSESLYGLKTKYLLKIWNKNCFYYRLPKIDR